VPCGEPPRDRVAAIAIQPDYTRARQTFIPKAGVPKVQSLEHGSRFAIRRRFGNGDLRQIGKTPVNQRRESFCLISSRACHVVLLAQNALLTTKVNRYRAPRDCTMV
jgi:hypothetical protein